MPIIILIAFYLLYYVTKYFVKRKARIEGLQSANDSIIRLVNDFFFN
jgi:hypothetical protein